MRAQRELGVQIQYIEPGSGADRETNEGPIPGGNYQLTTAGHVQDIAGPS